MAIVIHAEVRFDPNDMGKVRIAAQEMAKATCALEPGCLKYAFAEDVSEPGLMRVIEMWVDDAALKAHFAAPHMAAFNAALADAPPKSLTAERIVVSEHGPLNMADYS